MNDSKSFNDDASCEARAQDISLFVAGCLTAQEEQSLRAHLATCDACRDRCEQLQSLCSDLRAAKPEYAAIRFKLSDADLPRVTQRDVTTTSQARLGLIAAIAAAVLMTLGLLSVSSRRPARESHSTVIDIAEGTPSQAVPDESPNRTGQPAQVAFVPQPTLFALRQAAAVSDDALDRLMAQSSVSMFSPPLSALPQWSEK